MSYLDCIEVHNIHKAEGVSYIDEISDGKKAFMLKRYNELDGKEKESFCHAEFTKKDLVSEKERIQAQVDSINDFITEQFPNS